MQERCKPVSGGWERLEFGHKRVGRRRNSHSRRIGTSGTAVFYTTMNPTKNHGGNDEGVDLAQAWEYPLTIPAVPDSDLERSVGSWRGAEKWHVRSRAGRIEPQFDWARARYYGICRGMMMKLSYCRERIKCGETVEHFKVAGHDI